MIYQIVFFQRRYLVLRNHAVSLSLLSAYNLILPSLTSHPRHATSHQSMQKCPFRRSSVLPKQPFNLPEARKPRQAARRRAVFMPPHSSRADWTEGWSSESCQLAPQTGHPPPPPLAIVLCKLAAGKIWIHNWRRSVSVFQRCIKVYRTCGRNLFTGLWSYFSFVVL